MSKGIDDLPHVCNLRANCCQEFTTILECTFVVVLPHTLNGRVLLNQSLFITQNGWTTYTGLSPNNKKTTTTTTLKSCINKVVLGGMELTSQRDYVPICKV